MPLNAACPVRCINGGTNGFPIYAVIPRHGTYVIPLISIRRYLGYVRLSEIRHQLADFFTYLLQRMKDDGIKNAYIC